MRPSLDNTESVPVFHHGIYFAQEVTNEDDYVDGGKMHTVSVIRTITGRLVLRAYHTFGLEQEFCENWA